MEVTTPKRPKLAKLTGPNYRNWAMQMRLTLRDQRVWSAIDQTYKLDDDVLLDDFEIPPPPKSESGKKGEDALADKTEPKPKTKEELFAQAKRDQLVKRRCVRASTIILAGCAQNIVDQIVRFHTAKEKWEKLEKLFARIGIQQISSKAEAFNRYSPSSTASVSEIVTRLDDLQDEINRMDPREAPTDLNKSGRLVAILSKRGGKYDTTAAQIMVAKVTDYEDIVQHFLNIEEKIVETKPVAESARQASTSDEPSKVRSGRGRGGRSRFSLRGARTCYHCGKTGHFEKECRSKERGEPPSTGPSTGPLAAPGGGKGLSPPPEGADAAVASVVIAPSTETSWVAAVDNAAWVGEAQDKSVAWIMDSGCSRHMTFDEKSFVNYVPLDRPIPVRLANGLEIQAIAEGTAAFDIVVRGEKRRIQLHGVLHVPGLAGNLISVSGLQDRGIMTRTTSSGKMLLELKGQVIGVAVRSGRSYVLEGT
jgi:hypothetical protein